MDSVSPIGTPGVATSFALFCLVYLIVYTAGFAILLRLMGKTPVLGEPGPDPSLPSRSAGITLGLPQAAVWDGNETWLILGGGGLFAVFPMAYAIIMPALYPLIITMLLALVFRGVAFEFRFRTEALGGRKFWDLAFFGGSVVAGLCPGMILGALLQEW